MYQFPFLTPPENFCDSDSVIRILIPAEGIHEYLDVPAEVNPHFSLFAGKFLLEMGNSANIELALQATTADLSYLPQDTVETYLDDITSLMERLGEKIHYYLNQVLMSYRGLVETGESPFVEIDIMPDTLVVIIYT